MTHPPPAFSEYSPSSRNSGTSDPAPSYQVERYRDIWDHWSAVDRANRRIVELHLRLSEIEPELQAKTKEYERLKKKSSELFGSLHGKSRSIVSTALKRINSGMSAKDRESKERLRQDFEMAHREETSLMTKIETLSERKKDITTQVQKNMGLASEADQIFELIGASVASLTSTSGPQITAAEQLLTEAVTSHNTAQILVTDLLRARVTVQHAHHYYTSVLQTLDALRGTAIGRAALGGVGEITATQIAAKAQICFNETVRVLTPHTTMLPAEVMADFEKLKELGLLQASKIYGLMYGWKRATSGTGMLVSGSIKLMLQKQEIAFACLTRVAVWVQNEVPVAEAGLFATQVVRDKKRQDLVTLWKAHIMPESPMAP
ncbi:hypothetical protein K439DRAFT_1663190 [Ramaria rubella]|nr:hypothetical protein K439DRAFT_1663190 [Ramaria rubella]